VKITTVIAMKITGCRHTLAVHVSLCVAAAAADLIT